MKKYYLQICLKEQTHSKNGKYFGNKLVCKFFKNAKIADISRFIYSLNIVLILGKCRELQKKSSQRFYEASYHGTFKKSL